MSTTMPRPLNVIVPELMAAYERLCNGIEAHGPYYDSDGRVSALLDELTRDHGMTFPTIASNDY